MRYFLTKTIALAIILIALILIIREANESPADKFEDAAEEFGDGIKELGEDIKEGLSGDN